MRHFGYGYEDYLGEILLFAVLIISLDGWWRMFPSLQVGGQEQRGTDCLSNMSSTSGSQTADATAVLSSPDQSRICLAPGAGHNSGVLVCMLTAVETL